MKRNKNYSRSCLQWLVPCLLLLMAGPLAYAQENTNNLFSSAGTEGLAFDQPAEPYLTRSRAVTLNLASLTAANPFQADGSQTQSPQSPDEDSSAAPAAPAAPLHLNLFPDVDLPVTFNDLHGNTSGSMTWTGKVEGNEDSLIILVVKDGVMIGNITVGSKQYQVRYVGNDIHVVHEIDQSGFPSELDPDRVEYPPADPSSDSSFPALDDDAALDSSVLDGRETMRTIDVLVVYTNAARVSNGGTTAINNLIDLAITESNTGYANSGINQMLNLVHTAEVSYTETFNNIQLDRDRLKNPSDGFMDNVHTLRDTYDADLVSLIVDSGDGCGIAYIMDPVSTQFEDSAFCVVVDSCATGNYSFGHELGHIMGARHDWYVDPTDNSPYSYNHALTNPTDRWRTVMAYNNACADAGTGNCARLLYWSNPDKTYGGDAMGTREGLFQAEDNRKTLANTGFVVANFRVRDTSAEPSEEFASGAVPDNANTGVMFDLRAKKQTTIHGFSSVFTSAGTVTRVEIYYREGSYTGFDANSSAWKLAGSATGFTVQASPAQTHIPIDLDITIPAGQTYAFYITTPDTTRYIRYRNGSSEGAVYASNASLVLMQGRGKAYPFGASASPRVFAGTIYHSFSNKLSSLEVNQGNWNGHNGVMFDIKAKKEITIQAFSSYLYDASNDIVDRMEIYYRKGTHVGHENTAGDWTLLGSVNNVIASRNGTAPYTQYRVPIDLDVTIPAGQTWAFYLTSAEANGYLHYYNGTSVGSVAASNNHLELLEGTGKAYPFGGSFAPRVFKGTIYYTGGGFPWTMFLPAITASQPITYWGALSYVYCPSSAATFSLTSSGVTKRSTCQAGICPGGSGTFEGWVTNTPGVKSFSAILSSSTCGTLTSNFTYPLVDGKYYLFAMELNASNDPVINIYVGTGKPAGARSGKVMPDGAEVQQSVNGTWEIISEIPLDSLKETFSSSRTSFMSSQ